MARFRGRRGFPDGPWCLFVTTDTDIEHPPPKEYVDYYRSVDFDLPESYSDDMACYWVHCELQDRSFGMLLDALRESGQEDDTIVLFLSNHGTTRISP